MQSTPTPAALASADGLAAGIDLGRLWQQLATLTDSRSRKGCRYPLAAVLVLIVLAKLGGEDRPSGIADWVRSRGQALRTALHLSWPRLPHHNTYRRILADVVPPEAFDRIVGEYLGSLPGAGQSELLALDGKTVRGTRDATQPHGTHLLSAYLPAAGLVLGQVSAGGKDNEISVAPTLLAGLDLRGKVVTADALHTQRHLAQQILDAGGDYVWLVKDNQPTLRADIEELFTADPRTVLGGRVPDDFRTARTVEKGHGRLERRTLTTSRLLTGYCDWPGLGQVFRLVRERTDLQTGAVEHDVVYGITSLTAAEASPTRVLDLTRAHWGIENGLHYRRDVTFHEDATRLTQGQAGWVMATLNNLVLGLLRHTGATNLAAARRDYDARLTLNAALAPARPLT